MTGRDRLMLIAFVALGVLVAGYLMVVSPEREKASKLAAEVTAAHQQLESAQTAANEAASARGRYTAAYASLVTLGPAVPASSETPALVYALDAATKSKNVKFTSIISGGNGSTSSTAGASGSSSSSASAAAANTSFSQMPFSFVFNGSFEDLYKLLAQLEGFTTQTASGGLRVSGRLLTIDGLQLSGSSTSAAAGSSAGASSGGLAVTVTATAYVLPAGAQSASGASPAAPGASSTSSAGGSSPTSAAVVKAP